MEQALYRDPYDHLSPRRARPVEKGRDPYDGLRPWSAITHGVGAALGVAATVALVMGAARLVLGKTACGGVTAALAEVGWTARFGP